MIEVFPLDNKRYRAAALGGFLGTRTRGVFSAENNLAVRLTGGMGLKVNSGHGESG